MDQAAALGQGQRPHPLQALRHWAGQDEDERAGRVPAGVEFELPGLQELEELAAVG
ncbi:hypothetical protein ACFQ0B_56495 [Nonomuraea thailandensis]